MDKEIRSFAIDAEFRAVGNTRTIEGYGIVFNKESIDLGGFTEVILPSAIEGVINKSDVLALLDHDVSRGVLARSTNGTGSLSLVVDQRGVRYSFQAPKTMLGDEVVEGITRGDIKSSSFAFTIAPGGAKWERRSDGSRVRYVSKFDKIYDMSPCYREFYQDATVAVRSMKEFIKDTGVSDSLEVNVDTATTVPESLIEERSIPPYSNQELAMRARNKMYEQN